MPGGMLPEPGVLVPMPDVPVNDNATHSSNVAASGHSYKSFAEYRNSPRTEGNPLRLTVMLLYTVSSDT